MNWSSLLQNLGAFAIASGLLAWLVKKLIDQSLKRSLQAFEADLKRRNDVEIERLRSDLRSASFEHETKFARLHETRAEIVAELYKRLVQTEDAINTLLSPGQPAVQEDREVQFHQVGDLWRFFDERQIYFDEELCELMDKQRQNLTESAVYFLSPELVRDPSGQFVEPVQTRLDELVKSIPAIRHAIERRMREMLGVSKPASHPA